MRMKLFVFTILVLFIASFGFAGDIEIGGKLTLEKSTPISDILANPDNFLDKPIRVEGYILDGCKHEGTWIALASDKEFENLQVWHKDGALKFPLDHKGKYAIVEGSLYFVQLTAEQAKKWLAHLSTTHEQKVDPEKVKDGMKIYRINPTAVIIKDQK